MLRLGRPGGDEPRRKCLIRLIPTADMGRVFLLEKTNGLIKFQP
jgi:hypothetical protein